MPNWKKVIVSGSNAVLNNITASGHLTALDGGFIVDTADSTELEVLGNITASGNLFASLTDANGSYNNTVMYDTATGRFYYTGSYGGGGGDLGGNGTVVVANPGGSPGTALTSITIGDTDFSIAGEDDDWEIDESGAGPGRYFIKSQRNVVITGSAGIGEGTDPALTIKSVVDPAGELGNPNPLFRVVGYNEENAFEVIGNAALDDYRFAVNDNFGAPLLSVDYTGEVQIKDELSFIGNTNRSGIVLVKSDADLNTINTNGACRGDIIKIGDISGLTTGYVYYWTGTTWSPTSLTDATYAGSLLAVALGNNSSDSGMLLRGVVNITNSVSPGQQVYMGDLGTITTDIPTGTNEIVRSLGHSIEADVIYFNPSPDYIIIN